MSPLGLSLILLLCLSCGEGKILSSVRRLLKRRHARIKTPDLHPQNYPTAVETVELFTEKGAAMDYLDRLDVFESFQHILGDGRIEELEISGRCKDRILTRQVLKSGEDRKPYEYYLAKWFNLYGHVPGYAEEGEGEDEDNNSAHVMVANYIKTLREISHPNLPSLLGAFRHERNEESREEAYTVIMCYVKGYNLAAFERPPFTEEMIAGMCHDILQALDVLHSRNIVHMRVGPDNIMFDKENNRYILIDYQYLRQVGQPIHHEGDQKSQSCPGFETASPLIDLCALGSTVKSLLGKNPSPRDRSRKKTKHSLSDLEDFIDKLYGRASTDFRSASELLNHPFIQKYCPDP